MISFFVQGRPIPKQSTRFVDGHCYTPRRVRDWQANVTLAAYVAMAGEPLLAGPLEVTLVFHMPTRKWGDLDNLSKCVLDAMNRVVYADDSQVCHLDITRVLDKANPGVWVSVGPWEPPF